MAEGMRSGLLLSLLLSACRFAVQGAEWRWRWVEDWKSGKVDESTWTHINGDGSGYGAAGWGNEQEQCYWSGMSQVVNDGANGNILRIKASHDARGFWCYNDNNAPTVWKNWISGRLTTKGKKSFVWNQGTAGIALHARVKVPAASGTWAVLSLEPEKDTYGSGCSSGAMTWLSHVNFEQTFYSSVHSNKQDGRGCAAAGEANSFSVPTFYDWHDFVIEWTPDQISYSIDWNHYLTVNRDAWYVPQGGSRSSAPFDQPFYINIWLAMGGTWPRNKGGGSSDTSKEHNLEVNFIRVFDILAASTPQQSPTPAPAQQQPVPAPATAPAAGGGIQAPGAGARLLWSDEFVPCSSSNCVNGGVRTDYWSLYEGDLVGTYNKEDTCYVPNQVQVVAKQGGADGVLRITAKYYDAGFSCKNSGPSDPGRTPNWRNWATGRIDTHFKKSWMWGGSIGSAKPLLIETLLKVPMWQGTWPAVWMLPQEPSPYGSWCSSGEIDIMEHVNNDRALYGTLHYGGSSSNMAAGCQNRQGIAGTDSAGDWHKISVLWSPDFMAWAMDGKEFHRVGKDVWWSARGGNNDYAPFDKPFYLIINLAMGGVWPKTVDLGRKEHVFEVDYVRMWEMPN